MATKLSKISLSSADKIGFISNLSTMLEAGIPILEIIESLHEDATGNLKKMLQVFREDLVQGHRLNTIFAKFPSIFDAVTVSVLRASEEAGTLDTSLKDIRKTIEKDVEFSDRIKSALIYPVFILFVFLGVMFMMLVVVIPKISQVFSRLNTQLPLPTRMMIAASDFILKQTLLFLAISGAVAAVGFFVFRKYGHSIVQMFYGFPLIRVLVKQIDMTRFSRSMYLLLSSGIAITNALEFTEGVVVKRESREIIAHSRTLIMSGKTLTEGFKWKKGYIPTIMMKLIEAGEKSGSLDRCMQEISEYFDYQVSNTLKTLTALVEPILLVVIGVMVGGMMLSIIGPIYGMIGSVGTR